MIRFVASFFVVLVCMGPQYGISQTAGRVEGCSGTDWILAGQLYGAGSYNSNFNQRVEILLPENIKIDSRGRQESVHAENGNSEAHSPLQANQIPDGLCIKPSGTDEHHKGWAVHTPQLVGVRWENNGMITRFAYSMFLYCTTGSGEEDRLYGGCNVRVDVYYRPYR